MLCAVRCRFHLGFGGAVGIFALEVNVWYGYKVNVWYGYKMYIIEVIAQTLGFSRFQRLYSSHHNKNNIVVRSWSPPCSLKVVHRKIADRRSRARVFDSQAELGVIMPW